MLQKIRIGYRQSKIKSSVLAQKSLVDRSLLKTVQNR